MRQLRIALWSLARTLAWAASVFLAVLTMFLVSYFLGWKSVSPPAGWTSSGPQQVDETNTVANWRRARASKARTNDETRATVARLARRLLEGRDHRSETARVTAEIALMDADAVRRALCELEDAPRTRVCSQLRMLLLLRWVSLNPQAAWDYAHSKPEQLLEEVPAYGSVQAALLQRWAAADPVGALQAWQQLGDAKPGDPYALRNIFSRLGSRDFDYAVGTINILSAQEQQEAWAGLAMLTGRDDVRPTLLKKLASLPPSELRSRALSEALRVWADSGKVTEAVAWLDKADLKSEEMRRAEEQIASAWYRENRAAAADWLMSRSASRRAERLEQIVLRWGQDDPVACGQWLVQQGLGPEASGAMGLYAKFIATDFPEHALVWAHQIPEAPLRQQAVARVESILRERHPHRAEQLIMKAGANR